MANAAPQSVASSCWTNGTFWPRRPRASFSSTGNSSAAPAWVSSVPGSGLGDFAGSAMASATPG